MQEEILYLIYSFARSHIDLHDEVIWCTLTMPTVPGKGGPMTTPGDELPICHRMSQRHGL